MAEYSCFPAGSQVCGYRVREKGIQYFANDMKYSATTRFSAFGTLHVEGTEVLMELLEAAEFKGIHRQGEYESEQTGLFTGKRCQNFSN